MLFRDELHRGPFHERYHEIRTDITVNIVVFTIGYIKMEGQHLGQSKQQL